MPPSSTIFSVLGTCWNSGRDAVTWSPYGSLYTCADILLILEADEGQSLLF